MAQQLKKNRAAMNAKTLVFVIFVETILYFFFYNMHDYTFNCFVKELNMKFLIICHWS